VILVRPCWQAQCSEKNLPVIGEAFIPFHQVLVSCPVHGEQWWLAEPL
jgi:hypothetical protein